MHDLAINFKFNSPRCIILRTVPFSYILHSEKPSNEDLRLIALKRELKINFVLFLAHRLNHQLYRTVVNL